MRQRAILFAGLLLAATAAASAQPLFSDAPGHRAWEIGLYGGISLSQIKGSTIYADQWGNFQQLRTVNERTAIATNAKTGFAAGGFVTYYFSPGFGLQGAIGYAKSDVPNTAACAFSWSWADGSSYSQTGNWAGTGSLRSIPISLNIVARFGRGALAGYFAAGPTAFLNSFTADSFFGYGITTLRQNADNTFTQYIDALKVGLTIPNTAMKKTIYGANFGAGATLRISDALGLRADVRYYYCPESDLTWSFVNGTYDGAFFGEILGEAFGAADAALLKQTANTFTIRINPSLIHVSLGLVFSFGGGR